VKGSPRMSTGRTRSHGEIVYFTPGQFWVSVDREKFAEVAEVSDDSWTATVVVTDATGHRLARATVSLPQFQEQWNLVPEDF
jgi:hypothetical protein